VQSVEALDVGNELETLDPFVGAEQVEVGGTDEVDGRFIAVEKTADVADAFERSGFAGACPRRFFLAAVRLAAAFFFATGLRVALALVADFFLPALTADFFAAAFSWRGPHSPCVLRAFSIAFCSCVQGSGFNY
jgi:hypothetical protein